MTLTPLKQPGDGIVPPESPAMTHQRKARILLGKVDSILKHEGVEAAMKALMQVRLKTPQTAIIRSWIRDYQDMLMAWYADLMPEVVEEYKIYGFRRARNMVFDCISQTNHERTTSLYMACERVLEQMAQRFGQSIRDCEGRRPETIPQVVSLEEVSDDQLERGTKY